MHIQVPSRGVAAFISGVILAGGVAGAAGVAVAGSKPQKITPKGVGRVKLGATYTSLRRARLIGTIHNGCELAGPNARSANLNAPLKGGVDFTLRSPRKVMDITVTHGATARGVGIGGTIKQIKAKFPGAIVDHTHEGMFALAFVRIPNRAGGKLEFGVDVKTKKIVLIGIPFIATCD